MKSKSIIITLITLIFYVSGYGQNLSKQDSVQIFSDSLFHILEKNYLHKKSIKNWEELKAQFLSDAANHSTFEEALKESRAVFDSIGCSHCMLFSETGYYSATQRPLLFEDYSSQFVEKYAEGVEFSVSKLQGDYGYIVIPGMLFLDLPKDSINQKAQEMYNQIVALDKNNKLKGWIIDLRFNIGGDAYLMLSALYHFLGNKVVCRELDSDKNLSNINQLIDGTFYSGDEITQEIEAHSKPDLNTPVAFIIGNWTASAGENVLLGFEGRKNVIKIGEPTYGFLTGNDMFDLPFKVKTALTMAYMADMYGNYKEYLEPDILIKQKDNFDNLFEDQNIIEAIKFIDSRS